MNGLPSLFGSMNKGSIRLNFFLKGVEIPKEEASETSRHSGQP